MNYYIKSYSAYGEKPRSDLMRLIERQQEATFIEAGLTQTHSRDALVGLSLIAWWQ